MIKRVLSHASLYWHSLRLNSLQNFITLKYCKKQLNKKEEDITSI